MQLKIPRRYKRIASIKLAPSDIQDELVKIPSVLEEDSSFESDEIVIRRYKKDPLRYVLADDAEKMEFVKNKREANRYYAALEKIGLGHQYTINEKFHQFKQAKTSEQINY